MHMVIRLWGVVSLLLRHKRHWPTASAKTVGVPKDLTSATNFSTLDLWIGHSGRSSGGPVSCFWQMLAASFNLLIATWGMTVVVMEITGSGCVVGLRLGGGGGSDVAPVVAFMRGGEGFQA